MKLSDATPSIGKAADAPTMDSLGKDMEGLGDGSLQLVKWRYCWWLVGKMGIEIQNLSLSTSRRVTWSR